MIKQDRTVDDLEDREESKERKQRRKQRNSLKYRYTETNKKVKGKTNMNDRKDKNSR